MAALSANHAGYQERLGFIQRLLVDQLFLSEQDAEQTKIVPIQYDPDCLFKYNNFIYRLSLPDKSSETLGGIGKGSKFQQPGCVPIPAGTMEFILRLSNTDAESMHYKTRVENEVGMLNLASAALSHIKPAVIPSVFGWSSASRENTGWILEELMPGLPVAEAFEKTMSLDQKKRILAQMAEMLKALQDFPLPDSIGGWGGVTLDDSGSIVSAPMTSVGAGPWSSFEGLFRGCLETAITEANSSPILQGWWANGVRERVDAFIEYGLSKQFRYFATKQDKSIVHADFTLDNMLYDPATDSLTALLDFDFASITHPAYEFFRSFGTTGGQFSGWSGNKTPRELALWTAKLTGQFESTLTSLVARNDDDGIEMDWELARMWEDELRRQNVKRPSTIQGIDMIAEVHELLEYLLPWKLTNGDFLRMNCEEDQIRALRRTSERHLTDLLKHLGF